MLEGDFLSGLKIMFQKVKYEESITIRLMVEEDQEGLT